MIEKGHDGCDKRRSYRLSERFPVTVLEAEVTTQGAGAPGVQNSYLAEAVARKAIGMNISKGGLAFEATKPYRTGTILAFEVVLPEPQDCLLPLIRRFVQRQMRGFRAVCQVVWVGAISAGNYRMGVRFIDTNEQRSGGLEQLIAEYRWQQRLMNSIEGEKNRLTDGGNDWEQF